MPYANSDNNEIPTVAIRLHENEASSRRTRSAHSDTEHDNSEGEEEEEGLEDVVNENEEIALEDDEKENQKSVNSYAAKKTVAQGMMDIALITANANQLRFLVEFNQHSYTFYVSVTLIIISILLQIAIGVSLIFKGRLDFKGQSKKHTAKVINNYVVIGVFLVTIINVFIASFTVTGNSPSVPT